MPKHSQFDPYDSTIRRLASQHLTSQEIVDRLPIEASAKALQKYMKRRGIQGLPRGARSGKKHHNWRGGVVVEKGYATVYAPGHPEAHLNHVREHRLVMEKVLGRPLDPAEVVHHIDGDPLNNSPENLRLYPNNAAHLSETRAGIRPNWTEEGLARLRAAYERRWGRPSPDGAFDTPKP